MHTANQLISAIVLAAGESRRMGAQNKLLLPYENKTVIQHVVGTILQADVDAVYVVVGHEQDRVRQALDNLKVTFLENPDYVEGMGTSIRTGVERVPEEVAGYMICLSDLPLVTADEYSYLLQGFRNQLQQNPHAISVPRYKGQRGNPVILSSLYRPAMLSHQGVMGCRGIVKQHPEHVTFLEMETDHVLRDIDTPEAYERIRVQSPE